MINAVALKEWLPLLNLVGPILLLALVGYLRKLFATKDELRGMLETITVIEQRMQTHSDRLNRGEAKFEALDTRIRHLATAEQIADMRVAMANLDGSLRVVNERAEGLEDQLKATRTHLSIMDEHLRGMKS